MNIVNEQHHSEAKEVKDSAFVLLPLDLPRRDAYEGREVVDMSRGEWASEDSHLAVFHVKGDISNCEAREDWGRPEDHHGADAAAAAAMSHY